jgi:hypothetical protein
MERILSFKFLTYFFINALIFAVIVDSSVFSRIQGLSALSLLLFTHIFSLIFQFKAFTIPSQGVTCNVG